MTQKNIKPQQSAPVQRRRI
ncbi:anacyclamide/piricyclamide family prenylated cyclic peptide [Planktothrix agardhii]